MYTGQVIVCDAGQVFVRQGGVRMREGQALALQSDRAGAVVARGLVPRACRKENRGGQTWLFLVPTTM